MKRISAGMGVVLLAAAFSISAQNYPINARIASLGGTYIVDDMSDLLRYPGYIDAYKNAAQVTFVSPIIGIAGIGDMVSLGVVANRGLLLTDFYARGLAELSGFTSEPGYNYNLYGGPFTAGAAGDLTRPQNIPHFLLGLNLGAVSLGFDLFMEMSSYSVSVTDRPVAPGVERNVKLRASILNPGAIIGLNLNSDVVTLAFKLGGGFPSIHGKYEETGQPDLEVTSEKNYYVVGGAELGIPLPGAKFKAGAQLHLERYQFSDQTNTLSDVFTYYQIPVFAGFTKDLGNDMSVSAMYTIALAENIDAPETDGYFAQIGNQVNLFHVISACAEKKWQSVWIFDAVAARAGILYPIANTIIHSNGEDADGSFSSREKLTTTYANVAPTVGLGANRGPFSLDLSINPTAWNGLMAGPQVAVCTATFKF